MIVDTGQGESILIIFPRYHFFSPWVPAKKSHMVFVGIDMRRKFVSIQAEKIVIIYFTKVSLSDAETLSSNMVIIKFGAWEKIAWKNCDLVK